MIDVPVGLEMIDVTKVVSLQKYVCASCQCAVCA